MFLKDLIDRSRQTVSTAYPEREASEMVFILLEHIAGTKRHTHIIEPSYVVPDEKVTIVENACARLASGEPLQYVMGKANFYGRDFHVNPSVLIPRPETEILCRAALDLVLKHSERHIKVLDLCTGSGCIAWTMALECPGAEVIAVDISDGALEVAGSQCFIEEIERTGAVAPNFCKADVLAGPEAFCRPSGSYDLILSNPPYVMDKEKALMRPNVLEHEPHLALFVSDEDPLVFYRAVADWACAFLSPDGTGIVEINEALGPQTAQVFHEAGFSHAEIMKDFSNRDRFVLFRH